MTSIRLLLLTTILCSCGLNAPDIETADVYKVYNQDKAMLIIEARFEDYYGIPSNAFREAQVFWTDTPCPYSDDWAVVVDNRCYYGAMWGCDEMYVAMSKHDPDHTCTTALAHEFGHCLRMEAGWDADNNHSEDEFWDLIALAREETCGRGW